MLTKERSFGSVFFWRAPWAIPAGLTLLVLSWLTPNHYPPWTSFHSELLAFVAVALMVLGMLVKATHTAELPRLTWWILGALCLPWLQSALGISLFAGDALVVSFYLLTLTGAIWVGHAAIRTSVSSELFMMNFMYAVCIGALVSAAIGLLQWLSLEEYLLGMTVFGESGYRALGNMAQPNHLATLLLMGIIALVYLFEKQIVGSLALGIGVAFLSMVLLLTQSRTGLLSASVMAAFAVLKRRDQPFRLKTVYVIAWAFALLAGSRLLPLLQKVMLVSSGQAKGLTDSSGRELMWQQIAYGVGQSPWFGYGWNQTPTAHSVGAVAYPGELSLGNAHNFVLDMVAWSGLPVGLTLSGACFYWLISRARHARSVRAWHAMACLLPFFVHSMLEFPFAYAYFLLPAGILMGIVEATRSESSPLRIRPYWLWCILAVSVTAGVAVVREYFLIEEDFRIVRFENLRVGATPDEYRAPDIHLLTHMGAMLKQARIRAHPDMRKDELEDLHKVALRFPYAALTFRYAVALGLNGDPVGATRQMAVVRGMYGQKYYLQAIEELRHMQHQTYPQLSAVLTP